MAWCNAPGVQPALSASASVRPVPLRASWRRLPLAFAVLALGACDFPTEPPIFESRFVIPAEQTTLSVSELLPAEVSIAGNEFALNIQPVEFSRTLGAMCGTPCSLVNGLTVPKPAFSDTFPVTITFPADVQSAVVSSGAVSVTLRHTFGFDPIRPAGSITNGAITLTVRSGGAVVGSLNVTDAFAANTTLTRSIPITPGATITSPLTVDIGIISPAGSPVVVNTSQALSITASPNAVRLTQASVRVQATNVNVDQVELDLSDIDEEMAERVQSGALVLELTNPFAVGGTLTLNVSGAAVSPKQITVAACAAATPCVTTQRVPFTEAEMQSMLGSVVTFTITGQVSATGGFVTVRPAQQIEVDTQLDMVLRLGGDEN